MRVYKYGSRHVCDVLTNRCIRVSAATELNDPFELSPRIDATRFTLGRAVQFLRLDHQIDEWYRKEGKKLGFTTKKRYKAHYLKTVEDRARALLPKVPQNVEQARRDFAITFSDSWRLFCASEKKDSILMWSHYAAEHSGAVIEFDLTRPPFVNLPEAYHLSVRYSDNKADFYYKPKNTDSFLSALTAVARTKAKAWEYEQEIRLLFPITVCRDGHFVRVAPAAFRHVYVGARATAAYRTSIETTLKRPEMAHVGISTAHLSAEHYALSFDEVRKEKPEA